jgi:rRNA-processing protein FCF1
VLRKEVIVDTNALFIPGECGVDIFEELERLGYRYIILPKAVLNELNRLRTGLKGKKKRAADVGYSLLLKHLQTSKHDQALGRCTITILEAEEEEGVMNTDEHIVALACKRNAAVLTNDEVLRRSLSQAGIATVYLRGKSRLEEVK